MKAKHKVFDEADYSITEELFEAVDKFLSELGPKRLISVILRPVDNDTWDTFIVFYWEEEPGMALLRDINNGVFRGGLRTPQPVMITPTPPQSCVSRNDLST